MCTCVLVCGGDFCIDSILSTTKKISDMEKIAENAKRAYQQDLQKKNVQMLAFKAKVGKLSTKNMQTWLSWMTEWHMRLLNICRRRWMLVEDTGGGW